MILNQYEVWNGMEISDWSDLAEGAYERTKKEPKREEIGESKSGCHGKIKKQERARVAIMKEIREQSGCH